MNTSSTTLTVGGTLRVTRGCDPRRVSKGMTCIVREIDHDRRGGRVTLFFPTRMREDRTTRGSTITFYITVKDGFGSFGMNDGNPYHRIDVRV